MSYDTEASFEVEPQYLQNTCFERTVSFYYSEKYKFRSLFFKGELDLDLTASKNHYLEKIWDTLKFRDYEHCDRIDYFLDQCAFGCYLVTMTLKTE